MFFHNHFVFKNKLYFFQNKNYSSNSVETKNLTNIRHFPPTVREWENSVYSFNKNNSSSSLVKYNQLDKFIKNYFNITSSKRIARSKRMRYNRRKNSPIRVYTSKPEIKQTNDKIIITVYFLDRSMQILSRKLFFFNRPKIYDILSEFKAKRKIAGINNRANYKLPYRGIEFYKELKLFREKNNVNNRKLHQRSLLFYIKYILSVFKVAVFLPTPLSQASTYNVTKNTYSRRNIRLTNNYNIANIVNSRPNMLLWVHLDSFSIEIINKKDINISILKEKLTQSYKREYLVFKSKNGKNIQLTTLQQMYNKLFALVNKVATDNMSKVTLSKLFNNLSLKLNKHKVLHAYKAHAKETVGLIKMVRDNLLKYKLLLPSFKTLIDDLYNKKVELNLVNLKHFYLNSDIFTQILISKIKKRVSAAKVLKKIISKINTYKLGRNVVTNMPSVNKFNNIAFLNLNSNLSIQSLLSNMFRKDGRIKSNLTKHLNLENSLDGETIEKKHNLNKLDILLNYLYPTKFVNRDNLSDNYSYKLGERIMVIKSNIKSILTMIRNKSVLGVWVQAKGRLTRRNTAARSALHIAYKGSLKDKDQKIHLNRINNTSIIVLRNAKRSNVQYTSKPSLRRIGSFGIKAWISNK